MSRKIVTTIHRYTVNCPCGHSATFSGYKGITYTLCPKCRKKATVAKAGTKATQCQTIGD